MSHTPKSINPSVGGRPKPISREGKRFVGGHYDPSVQRELKIIAAKEDNTIQDLVGEALELLFANRGISKKVRESV